MNGITDSADLPDSAFKKSGQSTNATKKKLRFGAANF